MVRTQALTKTDTHLRSLKGHDEPDGVFGRPELNLGKEALRRLMVEHGLFWTATNVRWRIAAWNILLV
jgi:hypothetical protein